MLRARCARCDKDAELDDNATRVRCAACGYDASYDDYIEEMKGRAQDMAPDYVPDRPGV